MLIAAITCEAGSGLDEDNVNEEEEDSVSWGGQKEEGADYMHTRRCVRKWG
jgi:hypothetical protein